MVGGVSLADAIEVRVSLEHAAGTLISRSEMATERSPDLQAS
jgi:hypothetical protein